MRRAVTTFQGAQAGVRPGEGGPGAEVRPERGYSVHTESGRAQRGGAGGPAADVHGRPRPCQDRVRFPNRGD